MEKGRKLHRATIVLGLGLLILMVSAPCVNGLTFRDRFYSLVSKGNKFYAKGDNQKALENYQKAKSVDSTSVVPSFNAGDALYKMGRFDQALGEFSSAIMGRSDSTNAMAHYNIGNTFFKLGDLQSAIEAYKRALLIKPDDEDAKYNLEVALRLLKEQENQKKSQSDQGQKEEKQEQRDRQQNRDESMPNSRSQQQDKPDQEDAQMMPMGSIDQSELQRILAAIDATDREVQQELLKKRSSVKKVVGKDW